jgi:hypothetical protein
MTFLALLFATSAFAQVSAPAVTSEVAGIRFVSLTDLPHSPDSSDVESCGARDKPPTSVAGKQVTAKGWTVTSEADLGRYHVVSFAGGFEQVTGSLCFAQDANIAVYDGASLVALAYTGKSSHVDLGTLSPLEGGALLIDSNGPGTPTAELHADEKGLRVTAISPEQPVCKGATSVPGIYGKSIKDARVVLTAKGWTPEVSRPAPGDGDRAKDLVEHGFPEAESCAGTGLGYCGFNYRNGAIKLDVTTIGGESDDGSEDKVIGYSAKCP